MDYTKELSMPKRRLKVQAAWLVASKNQIEK